MWDPPRPGIEPISPALSGRFLTSGPPGSPDFFFKHTNHQIQMICVFFLKWGVHLKELLFYINDFITDTHSQSLLKNQ